MRADRFTAVQGPVIAMFDIPTGYTFDGNVRLITPLTTETFAPDTAEVIAAGKKLKLTFNKESIDNNIPAGAAVPLTATANFLQGGVQTKLTSTTSV